MMFSLTPVILSHSACMAALGGSDDEGDGGVSIESISAKEDL